MQVIGVKTSVSTSSDEILEDIEEYRRKKEVFIQIFDSDKVIGKEHLQWAYQKAKECFENGTNRADSLEIETLLWASAEWQIKDALDKMGVKDHDEEAVVLIEDEVSLENLLDFMGWTRDDDLLKLDKKKLKDFGIQEEEIEAVDDPYELVFEKMATSIL
ncbi:MAG: KEOPS complex subunit Cgi121 [Candidatus Aenigmatarchaeota archaeon]